MSHAAATILPAMFLIHVIVAIAIAPNTPRHHRGRPRPRKGRP